MNIIFGAFDSRQGTKAAIDQLQLFGFAASRIHVKLDKVFQTPPEALESPTSFFAGVRAFIAKAKHDDSTYPEEYDRAISRGSVLIAVDTDTDIEAMTARNILLRAGCVDPADDRRRFDSSLECSAEQPAVDLSERATADVVSFGGMPVYSHKTVPSDSVLSSEPLRTAPQPASEATDLATQADFTAFNDGIFEVRQTLEQLLVTKDLRVLEEITVSRTVSIRSETVTDSVRRTEIELETLAATPAPSP